MEWITGNPELFIIGLIAFIGIVAWRLLEDQKSEVAPKTLELPNEAATTSQPSAEVSAIRVGLRCERPPYE